MGEQGRHRLRCPAAAPTYAPGLVLSTVSNRAQRDTETPPASAREHELCRRALHDERVWRHCDPLVVQLLLRSKQHEQRKWVTHSTGPCGASAAVSSQTRTAPTHLGRLTKPQPRPRGVCGGTTRHGGQGEIRTGAETHRGSSMGRPRRRSGPRQQRTGETPLGNGTWQQPSHRPRRRRAAGRAHSGIRRSVVASCRAAGQGPARARTPTLATGRALAAAGRRRGC